MDNFLVISDLQIPFEHPDALAFCKYIKKHYSISDENIICAGDEVDHYYGSLYKKDPNATVTANQEIAQTKDTLKRWYSAFPLMKVANSNHQQRWMKKFTDAEIPSQLMRSYQELIEAPPGWKWADKWRIKTKHPFIVEHGTSYSGVSGHRTAAILNGCSTVIGHLHSFAGIDHIKTQGQEIWAANSGCLIDTQAFAFHYNKNDRFQPTVGTLVVVDNGRWPMWIPICSTK